jgi:hypothetical protein
MPRWVWTFGFLLLLGCAGREERGAELVAAFDNGLASLGTATAPRGASLPAAAPIPPRPAAAGPTSALQRVVAPTGPAPAGATGLLGAGPEALRRWLGEPALRRPEGGAEVWLYAGTACALDLVLYQSAEGLRVTHAAARASGTAPRTEAQCLQELAPSGRPRGGTLPLALGPGSREGA